jgi:hypothetical protein
VVDAAVFFIDVQTDGQWVCPIGAANLTILLIASSFSGATTMSRASTWRRTGRSSVWLVPPVALVPTAESSSWTGGIMRVRCGVAHAKDDDDDLRALAVAVLCSGRRLVLRCHCRDRCDVFAGRRAGGRHR